MEPTTIIQAGDVLIGQRTTLLDISSTSKCSVAPGLSLSQISRRYFGVCCTQMFFDLNVPIPTLQPSAAATQSKKGKAAVKQTHAQQPELSFLPTQIATMENRVELLIHRPSRVRHASLALTPMNV